MSVSNKTRAIAVLRNLTDELCSPDLTLGRGVVLRSRLFEILEAMSPRDAGAITGEVTRGEIEEGGPAPSHPGAPKGALNHEFTALSDLLHGPCVG